MKKTLRFDEHNRITIFLTALFLSIFLASGCQAPKPVIVWTIGDIFGLGLIGIAIVICIVSFIIAGVKQLQEKYRRKNK